MSPGRVNEMRNESFLAKRAAKNRPDGEPTSSIRARSKVKQRLNPSAKNAFLLQKRERTRAHATSPRLLSLHPKPNLQQL